MDILSEIGNSRLYTLHSHTQFCDGRADMETFLRAAIEAGFTHYGFSPHSPVPFESSCNMEEYDVPLYSAEVDRLRSIYGNVIKIYKSMEIDYIDDTYNAATPLVQSYGLDYTISSVHFIPTHMGMYIDIDGSPTAFLYKLRTFFHNDIHYVVDTFFAQSLKMIETGGFDIIGHFDKIGHNASYFKPGIENEYWYKLHMQHLIDAIVEAGIIVEINTKAREKYGRFFPSEAWWRQLIDRHVPIVVNSDAHYPDRINLCRDEAFKLLDNI